jgi:uncharacterized protein
MTKKTLVIGASENVERYSNMAIKKLLAYNHPVVAIGLREGEVQGVKMNTDMVPFENIDTITLYVNETNQKKYYDYILSLKPTRVIFNPGTENEALKKLCEKENIATLNACTLVMLTTNQY